MEDAVRRFRAAVASFDPEKGDFDRLTRLCEQAIKALKDKREMGTPTAAGSAILAYLHEADIRQKEFAALLGISPSLLSLLIFGKRAITREMAVMIELVTNKHIPRQKLRPDLWPFHEGVSAGVK